MLCLPVVLDLLCTMSVQTSYTRYVGKNRSDDPRDDDLCDYRSAP